MKTIALLMILFSRFMDSISSLPTPSKKQYILRYQMMEMRLTTRGYELDRSGNIPPANLLRYMEHLRWLALDKKSWDLTQLFANGRSVVVVAQRLEVLREIGVGIELVCTMSLTHVGQASMELLYVLQTAGYEEVVAHALVSLVHLDSKGASTLLPDGLRQSLRQSLRQRMKSGAGSLDRERMNLPDAPGDEAPADAWTRSIQVRPSDLDLLRHVNHAVYLDYFDDTRFIGATNGYYGNDSHLAKRPARRIAVEYRDQAVFGDNLTVWSWSSQDEHQKPGFGFELRRKGETDLLAKARIEVD